ncbi:class F sortase [Actinomadura scrupuli]|uniref:class F sortase n=1 Tax=Actinomadura scrupuli TaxID=559629 RepID=UPI003D96F0A9
MREPVSVRIAAVAVVALLTVPGLTGCGGSSRATAAATAHWSAVPGQVAVEPTIAPRPGHQVPVEVNIPSIGARSRLDPLTMDAHGVLTPPAEPGRAGWFSNGVRPGDPGPAVIAGHVDSRTGTAVFTRLATVRPGAAVLVTDAAGRTVTFKVDLVRAYPKSGFPTGDVYGATPDPQLRLITCGGGFDQSRGHYEDNVVVFASVTD